ncbi:hypothetical protein Tco_0026604 [Tanacetum coccineum]
MSPGNVALEGIQFELFRSTYPGRHVARETYPQRQVAQDTPDLSLGNMANVVVMIFDGRNGRGDVVEIDVYSFLKERIVSCLVMPDYSSIISKIG